MLDSELQYYLPETISGDGTNGGRMSSTAIANAQPQNVFRHAKKSERASGSATPRKIFYKANSDDNTAAESNEIYLDGITSADDWTILAVGTDTDTEADLLDSATKYGTSSLKAEATSTTSTLVATVEDVSLTTGNNLIFRAGEKLRISDKDLPTSGTGNSEILTINTVAVSGNDLTITTTTPLLNTYAGGSKVSSVFDADIIQATTDSIVSTGGATYDNGSYPPVLNNKGCITQEYMLTFTDSENFSVTGDSLTDLPSGNKSTDYEIPNPNFAGTNYIKLEYLGWTGTPSAGDTLTIVVSQAAQPMWWIRIIPAESGSLTGNKAVVGWEAESE